MSSREEKFEQLLTEIEQACSDRDNPQVPDELKQHLDELKDYDGLAEYIREKRKKQQEFEQILQEIEVACNGGENPQIPSDLKKHLDALKDFEGLAQYISKRRGELEL